MPFGCWQSHCSGSEPIEVGTFGYHPGRFRDSDLVKVEFVDVDRKVSNRQVKLLKHFHVTQTKPVLEEGDECQTRSLILTTLVSID